MKRAISGLKIARKIRLRPTITATITCLILAATPLFSGEAGLKTLEAEIKSKIQARSESIYKKYSGVECIRKIVSIQYDSRDNTYRSGYTVILKRNEYFFKKAAYKVLSYEKDGKKKPNWMYNYPTRKPPLQPFGPESDKNYSITLSGKKIIAGTSCWEFDVTPKKNTSRHLLGKAYFTVNNLDLLYLEGTIADYPVGLKSLRLELFFKNLEDAYVLSHGTYSFVIHFPLFYPHKKFVQSFTSYDDRLIPAVQK